MEDNAEARLIAVMRGRGLTTPGAGVASDSRVAARHMEHYTAQKCSATSISSWDD